MDHDHHHDHGAQDHPKTFDEVIARGFPLHLAMMEPQSAEMEGVAKKGAAKKATAKKPKKLPAATKRAVRKNATSGVGAAEQTAFKNAVQRMVHDGTYLPIVRHHMDMSHMMHGSMGVVGLYRFLAWHRRYLVEFERELQRVDAILRPGANDLLGVPYWPWEDPFPAWLAGFLPVPDPQTGAAVPARKNAAPPQKASASDVRVIVDQFAIQQTGIPQENEYTKFTYGIEGWGRRPDGTSLPAHNQGHAWVGGIMNDTSTSPTDPVFWMHHAEVDRLWESWRQAHPTPAPMLAGAQRVMDPWAESYDDLLDVQALGYTYESLVP